MYNVKKKIYNLYKHNSFAFCLGTIWFFLINSSVFFCFKYFYNFDNRHTYISDSIDILKLYINCFNEDKLKLIKKKGNIDSSNKRSKCELTFLYGKEKLYLNINAINIENLKKENEKKDDEYDKDISIYLENPYLIKKEIKKAFFNFKSFLLSFIYSNNISNENKKNIYFNENLSKEEIISNIINNQKKWKINNIILVKKEQIEKNKNTGLFKNLFNYYYKIDSIYGKPEENSYYYKYQRNTQLNKTQINILSVLTVSLLCSFVLAVKRIINYSNCYSSLNYIKKFMYENKNLHKIIGNNQIQILNISGQYKKNYVNSKIYFQAKEKQGVVHLTSTKNNTDDDFFLLQAKLLYNNEIISLKDM